IYRQKDILNKSKRFVKKTIYYLYQMKSFVDLAVQVRSLVWNNSVSCQILLRWQRESQAVMHLLVAWLSPKSYTKNCMKKQKGTFGTDIRTADIQLQQPSQ